jgi:serine/threonine-protein kinase
MLVDQLIRFAQEGGAEPPANLVDLIALRIARLHAGARRVLQALSIVRHGVTPLHMVSMVTAETDIDRGLQDLVNAGMIQQEQTGIVIGSSLIRQVAEASIPAAVRKELHERALELASDLSMPREARAEHALLAHDAFDALLLLDQCGEAALQCDDVEGAVLAYRQCLDVARREIANGELEDPVGALVIFSRKLGDALTRCGDVSGAEGVLREALDLADPNGKDRAQLLFSLANLEQSRSRTPSALKYLRESIVAAKRCGSDSMVDMLEEKGLQWST